MFGIAGCIGHLCDAVDFTSPVDCETRSRHMDLLRLILHGDASQRGITPGRDAINLHRPLLSALAGSHKSTPPAVPPSFPDRHDVPLGSERCKEVLRSSESASSNHLRRSVRLREKSDISLSNLYTGMMSGSKTGKFNTRKRSTQHSEADPCDKNDQENEEGFDDVQQNRLSSFLNNELVEESLPMLISENSRVKYYVTIQQVLGCWKSISSYGALRGALSFGLPTPSQSEITSTDSIQLKNALERAFFAVKRTELQLNGYTIFESLMSSLECGTVIQDLCETFAPLFSG